MVTEKICDHGQTSALDWGPHPRAGPICYPAKVHWAMLSIFHLVWPSSALPPRVQHQQSARPLSGWSPPWGCIYQRGLCVWQGVRGGGGSELRWRRIIRQAWELLQLQESGPSTPKEITCTKILTCRWENISQDLTRSYDVISLKPFQRLQKNKVFGEVGFTLETLGNLTFAMGGEGSETRKEVWLQTPGSACMGWLRRHCPLGCLVVLTNRDCVSCLNIARRRVHRIIQQECEGLLLITVGPGLISQSNEEPFPLPRGLDYQCQQRWERHWAHPTLNLPPQISP